MFAQILKWQLLPAVVCFNLAYFLASFPLWCLAFIALGLFRLSCAYYNSLSVSFNFMLNLAQLQLNIAIYRFYFYFHRFHQIRPRGRGVLVTGCDSGLGQQLAERLHSMEFTVFACCHDAKSYGAKMLQTTGGDSGRMHVLQMDVSCQQDVDNAKQYVESNLPDDGLWGVVNNAGKYSVGFLEWLPMEEYETVCIWLKYIL